MRQNIKKQITEFKWWIVGILGNIFLELLYRTIKIELKGFKKLNSIITSRKFIIAVWHSRLFLIAYLCRKLKGTAMVSKSKDGEFAARIVEKQGHKAVRGSTKKNGFYALAKLVRNLKKKNTPCVIVPDGPQGPRCKANLGVIVLAKKTGYPILPVTFSAKKIKVFASWDRFVLPYPFTKCVAIYGQPIYISRNADKNEEMRCLICLENELNRITFEADRYFNYNNI